MDPRARVLQIAAKEIGYAEGPRDNQTKYAPAVGHANYQPWCATWVVWVFRQAGVPLPNESAYTPTMFNGFKQQGRAVPVSKLEPGDVVFFKWPGMGRIAHVAIFEKWGPNGAAVCIEGNTNAAGSRTGGQVLRKVRKKGLITHAGRPNWAAAGAAPKGGGSAAAKKEEDDVALSKEDKAWIADQIGNVFRIVLRGKDKAGKATGHKNLEGLDAKLNALTTEVRALKKAVESR